MLIGGIPPCQSNIELSCVPFGCGLPLYGVFVVLYIYHGNSEEQHFYFMLDAFIWNSAIGTKDVIRPLHQCLVFVALYDI